MTFSLALRNTRLSCLMGRTLGANSDGMYFCAACHMGVSDNTDDLLFMEPEYRVQN
ncbi:hypothetical protein [Roseinatronobacter alkalisoli]|uniref:Uncharacterized protein n=1 Tax=Roseinatronobacter alkalisoli TaxID=3028235 RepID=A0ABT5T3E1_9RHOB|nr:hypothetical protein [Roseinatronobacter sp. HJB301]MDD7969642.1 hypothetical protein [Roseinatronobacter sp. HJB301]